VNVDSDLTGHFDE